MAKTHRGETIRCPKCASSDVTESERYGFDMKKLQPNIEFYGIVSAVNCNKCKYDFAFVDDTKDMLYWLTLIPIPKGMEPPIHE